MENKFKESILSLAKLDKKTKIIMAVGLIAVFLILISELIPGNTAQKNKSSQRDVFSYSDYVEHLEKNTCDIISSISGVGKCKVMITLKNSNESIYAKNTDENSNNSSFSKTYEYVLYDSENGEEPILVKEYMPQIQGVAIVCEGADNSVVRESVISSVSSLFNISSSKISVSKIKG